MADDDPLTREREETFHLFVTSAAVALAAAILVLGLMAIFLL